MNKVQSVVQKELVTLSARAHAVFGRVDQCELGRVLGFGFAAELLTGKVSFANANTKTPQ